MKQLAILGFVFSVTGFAGQAVYAEIKAADPVPPEQQSQAVKPAWLGIWIDDVPATLGKHLSSYLKQHQGVLIKDVSADSPAAKAGLQEFDIIAKMNDQEIFTREQLTRLIRSIPGQTTIKLTLIRQGKLITQDVILEDAPEQSLHQPKGSSNHPFPHGHFAPFSSPHKQSMPSPWSSPFFHQGPGQFKPMPPSGSQQSSWSEFESIQIESTGDNKHRAKVKHKDSDGNTREFVFEGTREEIKEQIVKLDDMDKKTKQSLLQALDMNTRMPFPPFGQHHRMPPDWFNQPFPMPQGFNPQR